MKLRFLGHASFVIEDEPAVAIDPFDISYDSTVDYIFITHSHYDHCSPEDIEKIYDTQRTKIVAPPDCKEKLATLTSEIITVEPGKEYIEGKLRFRTVPAYNIGKPFHPKKNGWVGYIIYLSQSIYHPGDTDFIPEMKGLNPDIFLVPIGGTYTMNPEEAARAVEAVSPLQYSVPMHYGKIVGSISDAEKFRNLCKGEVRILKPEG